MKYFNTAGPINPEDHYYVAHRLNEAEIRVLIEQKKYFILHAPRQSGKTTALREFAKTLNQEGDYKVVYVNIESGQAARNNVKDAMQAILQEFVMAIQEFLVPEKEQAALNYLNDHLQKIINIASLEAFLVYWSLQSEKPIIIIFDEIDSLVGDSLISVLRQLRSGYARRPKKFPQSVCLVGVRDVRDYRIWSEEQGVMVLGGSAFNIKAESLILPDFTLEQVKNLYEQHTQETGQTFSDEAIEYVFYLTRGQPWLVNAIAYQACYRDVTDRSVEITKEIIERSKEVLIERRDTHIDVLNDKLSEQRVRTIIDAILDGNDSSEAFPFDDISYARDLGLLARTGKGLVIANPIYQETIPRELTHTTHLNMRHELAWYQKNNGDLDVHKMLEDFQQFYSEHSEIWLEKFEYKDAGPQLLLIAFLQCIIDGGGTIHHEYGLGRKRIDLLICWQQQRIVLELKILRGTKTLFEGLSQTAVYMNSVNATEGHLVVFDRYGDTVLEDKVLTESESYHDKRITLWMINIASVRNRRFL